VATELAPDATPLDAATLVELAPVPLLATSLRGTIELANAAAAELLGVPSRFLVGKPIAVFAVDRRAIRLLTARAATLPPGGAIGDEATFVRRDDTTRRGAIAIRRVGDSLVWALHDVQWRSSVEVELRLLADELEARVQERTAELEAERARLDAILGGMPAGVIVADARSQRVILTNDQAARILGTEALVARAAGDYGVRRAIDDRDTEIAAEGWPLARTLETGAAVREARLRIERADGTWVTMETNVEPIRDAGGRVVAAVAVFMDVTARERRERAEREFVSNAAHELQTPLAAIVSAVEVLLGGGQDDADARARFLAHIDREANRLVRLVRALLVLARAQVASDEIATSAVGLRPLLDDVALTVRPRPGIEVRVRCPPDLAATTNRDLLEQALVNLASNAARHTGEGAIVLSARAVTGGVAIDVADSGAGLPAGDVERLFDRFSRAEPRTPDGFGLGLAIVRDAVTALGGTVSLRPRRGGGTVARIVLP
jgi:PAS domain S-box-containing protein